MVEYIELSADELKSQVNSFITMNSYDCAYSSIPTAELHDCYIGELLFVDNNGLGKCFLKRIEFKIYKENKEQLDCINNAKDKINALQIIAHRDMFRLENEHAFIKSAKVATKGKEAKV